MGIDNRISYCYGVFVSKTQIAETIAAQMGGVRTLKLMLGAEVYARENGLAFKFPNRKRKQGNFVVVTLRADDTYDVEFFNRSRLNCPSVAKFEGIYADQLVEIFERQTGWSLHVPKIVRA